MPSLHLQDAPARVAPGGSALLRCGTQSDKRVVVTGMGILSCLGNTVEDVKTSLHECKSGIKFNEGYVEKGMKSHVSGKPDIDTDEFIDRKQGRFMGSESLLPPGPCRSACPRAASAPLFRSVRFAFAAEAVRLTRTIAVRSQRSLRVHRDAEGDRRFRAHHRADCEPACR